MEAAALYARLEQDFIWPGITDLDWAARMPALRPYLHPGFVQRGMGLMCDFTEQIEQVYTTVFLSDKVLGHIVEQGVTNALVFTHHPGDWDIEHHGGIYPAGEAYIQKLKEQNIAIYVLHHPLDNFGDYATCKTLAEQFEMRIEAPGFEYCGALCGVVGTSRCKNTKELSDKYSKMVGHPTSLYQYGAKDICGEKIALCPGGGNAMFVLEEMLRLGVKTLVTGVTIQNEYAWEVHRFEQENGINVLGGTHYSSEKFAPMKMCDYFARMGLPAAFVEDEPDLYDL